MNIHEKYGFVRGMHVTDPAHGGKVTCHKCNGFIVAEDWVPYWDHQHNDEFPAIHFHVRCYDGYEHYRGLDKPLVTAADIMNTKFKRARRLAKEEGWEWDDTQLAGD